LSYDPVTLTEEIRVGPLKVKVAASGTFGITMRQLFTM
jgi:hypothetical protein